jgi:hypothetical protein
MKRGKYTTEIIRLNALGWTGKRIAEHLGCSGPHVSKVLYRYRQSQERTPSRAMDREERPTHGSACREWVLTPEGLKPCGAPKHEIGGETMGQCHAHYEAQRPHAGRIAA